MARSNESKQEIVGVSDVLQAPVIWIVQHFGGQLLAFTPQPASLAHVALALVVQSEAHQVPIGVIQSPLATSVMHRQKSRLNERIHPVKLNIRQQAAENSALRNAARSCVVAPLLEVSRPEHVLGQLEEAAVANPLAENRK